MLRSSADEITTSHGVLESLKGCISTWIALLRTRLEIVATELEEEKIRLSQIVVLAVAGILGLCFGVVMLSFFIVVLFWETDYRLWVIGGLTAFYLGIGIVSLLVAKGKAKSKPRLFHATLSELSKDERYLSSER